MNSRNIGGCCFSWGVAYGVLVLVPVVSYAQNLGYIANFITQLHLIVGYAIPVVIGLAVLFFLWGAFQFVVHGDDEKQRGEGRTRMIWGVIAIFVMVSLWGIVNLIIDTTGVGPTVGVNAPQANF